MKKSYIIYSVVVILTAFAVSCQKEDEADQVLRSFNAVIDMESKTHLTGDDFLGVAWDAGDEVMISVAQSNENTVGNRAIFKIPNNGINGSGIATFSYENRGLNDQNEIIGSRFCALYPASAAVVNDTGSMQLCIPMQQSYVRNSMKGSPMYAEYEHNGNTNYSGLNYSNDHPTFRFKNLCSQLRLNLQQSGVRVKSIIVKCTDNYYLSGNFDIYPYNATVVGTLDQAEVWAAETSDQASASNGKYVSLDCGASGVDITEATDFNIYLPVGYYNIAITIRTVTGGTQTIASTSAINFNRNHVKRLNLQASITDVPPAAPYANAGIFAINPTDHVYIANGNLMNTAGPNAYYEDSWRFAQHPYDMVTQYLNQQVTWNRFSWSVTNAGDNFGMKVDIHTNQAMANEDFLDWGVNSIKSFDGSTTYDPNYWFTLSSDEWRYLLGETVDGHNRKDEHMQSPTMNCFGYAYILPADDNFSVDYVHNGTTHTFRLSNFLTDSATQYVTTLYDGDNPSNRTHWDFPLGLYRTGVNITGNEWAGIPCIVIYPDDFPADRVLNSHEFFHNNHAYSLTYRRYNELVRLGCVFLPLLGQGQGRGGQTDATQAFIVGYYWARTCTNNGNAQYIKLTHNNTHISAGIESNTRGNGNAVRLVTPAPADSRHTTSNRK